MISIKGCKSGKINKLGLVGYPLGHTFSPQYFRNKFDAENIADYSYETIELQSIEGFKQKISKDFKGFNVTIPFKEQIINYCDELSQEAYEIGAVNTIKIIEGRWLGFNTDTYGFEVSVKPLVIKNMVREALILGDGGSAKAVKFALRKLGISYKVVSRSSGDLTYKQLDAKVMETHQLIVNTTPLGMYPNLEHCAPIPYHFLSPNHVLYDLIYNPEKTLFLKNGEEKNCVIKNGNEMLILQAEKSWLIWTTQQ